MLICVEYDKVKEYNMIGKCYSCRKENVECRETILKKYNHPKFLQRCTSDEVVLVCKDCDVNKPVTKESKNRYFESMDQSRYGKF